MSLNPASGDAGAQVTPRQAPTRVAPTSEGATRRSRWGVLLGLLLAMAIGAAAWRVAHDPPFTPASDVGYWMGVCGASMMALLLLYPLRKRWSVLRDAGPVRHWFRAHMILGIGGPMVILFHSTFRAGSLNGRIALYSMLVVALSGVLGRFIYARLHRGLYGQQLTLQELESALSNSVDRMNRLWLRAPFVRDRLQVYRDRALKPSGIGRAAKQVRMRYLLVLGVEGAWLRWHLARRLRQVLGESANRESWSKSRLRRERQAANREITRFIAAVQGVALMSAWERLFAWWHVAHTPLVYLLVLSSVAHVIAVHMY